MSDPVCVCGHPENMHYGGTKAPFRCMKIITHDPRLENHLLCTCREFRREGDQPRKEEAPGTGSSAKSATDTCGT